MMLMELVMPVPTLGFLGSIGWPELLVLGLLGVLIFGRRLPEVGRSLGRSLVEFKQGLAGVDEEVQAITKPLRTLDARTPADTPASGTRKAGGKGKPPQRSA